MHYIFSHRSSDRSDEFATKDAALEYLRHELPNQRAFRYRTTYRLRSIDSILFLFGGDFLAELVVAEVQEPTETDHAEYTKTRRVYLIDEIRIFANQSLRAEDFDLRGANIPVRVPDEVYQTIVATAGVAETIKRQA